MKRRWRLRRTTILTVGLIAFLVGLGLARLTRIDGSWVWFGLLLNLLMLKHRGFAVVTLGIFALTLGWWRGSVVMHLLDAYQPLYNQKIVFQAVAADDAAYDKRAQLSFDVTGITVLKLDSPKIPTSPDSLWWAIKQFFLLFSVVMATPPSDKITCSSPLGDSGNCQVLGKSSKPTQDKLIGKVKVSGFGSTMVYRGDKVQIEGKLFKTRGSRQASVSFAEVNVIGRSTSAIYTVVRRFNAGMESALPEPLASFALGVLIGQRSNLPDKVNKRLARVGLTHLIAVSGYNLTIIVDVARRLLGKRSKYQSTMVSFLLIGLFMIMTGLSASIVRAALVSVLSIGAWYYGRKIRPVLLICLAAALTAGWNPLYLWSDIGWYLSFLAFYGVLVLAPLLGSRLTRKKNPKLLTMILLESTSAQLMTAPLIMYIFGQVSIIGIVANLLVVPLVPIAMFVSLLAGLGGMFVPTLAGWGALPARLLLTYILDIVNLLSRVPHALASRSLLLWQMLCLYVVVVAAGLILWHKTTKNAKVTPVLIEE